MSEPQDQDIFERVARLLIQQKEMYGGFEIPKPIAEFKKEQEQKALEKNGQKYRGTEEKVQVINEPVEGFQEAPKELSEAEKISACSSLDELRIICETADILRTDLPHTNLVFGVGNPNADLMIVGEAPGENEDKQGEPFVGAAGQLLDKIMAAINFRRSDIYIANILKHRPPGNRDPKPEERERSLPYLLRQIEIVNPKLILCVGKVSATTLLNTDATLGSMRQKFHPFHNRELMVTYHPAALLRNQQWKRPTWEDVQLLRKRYDELGGKP